MPYLNPMPMGRPIKILDEGVSLTADVSQIDLVGSGVVGTTSGNNVTATISGSPGTLVNEQVPTGAIDGSNVTFTLAQTPVANTLKVTLNGVRQQAGGGDFTLSGVTITFVSAPPSSSVD